MKKEIKNISRAIPLAVALGVILIAAALAVTSAQAESSPIKIECTFYNPDIYGPRDSSILRESKRKVAPEDIAWLRPGDNALDWNGELKSPSGAFPEQKGNPHDASHIPAKDPNFVVLGTGSGRLTANTDLRKLCIQLAKVASDHRANAINYQISKESTVRVQFLRIKDAILQKVGRGQNPAQ
jgi:hypothetical protein